MGLSKRKDGVLYEHFAKGFLESAGDAFTKEEIEYFPWYMVMFYQREKEPEHYIYEVDLSGL